MVAPLDPMVPPRLASIFGKWMPGFRCATCYEQSRDEECRYCGEDISDGPSWPTWPDKMCGSCYEGSTPPRD